MISKRVSGRTYYYLATSARVDGKPRIVDQKYLGTADEIEAAMAGAVSVPSRSRHLRFGDLAATWTVIDKLDMVEVIDEVTGGRRADAGASVGTYLALAAMNRVVDPCSKLAFADWWAGTAGDHLVNISKAALDHRRFWDAMHALDIDALGEIERRIATNAITVFGLDTSSLALDMTNFATYIDSTNTRAPIAQRGKAKQKRSDLRLVGLGLVVARDGGVPLLSHAYPGDRPDVTQFAGMIDELAARHRSLGTDPAELTVVFDAGQNSQPNFEHLAEAGLGYIGSLPPSDHDDLLGIPTRDYQPIAAFDGLHAIEAGDLDALGRGHRALLTHSAELHAGQARGLDQTLAKAERELHKIALVLESGRGRRSHEQLTTAIDKIVNKRWVRDLLATTVTGQNPSTFRLSWHIDDHAREALEQRLFGKRILITDRHTWTATELIAGYRSQSDAEFGFRQLKDPHLVSFSPIRHWTEHNIRVHTLYCVLALMIAHLMRRTARQAGLHLSVPELLAQLGGIQQTVLLYPGTRGRPKARRMITDRTDLQQQLFDLFELTRWNPVR